MPSKPKETINDINKEFDQWVSDSPISTTDPPWNKGNCTADHHFNWHPVDKGENDKWSADYYACGGRSDGGHGLCMGLTHAQWLTIWSNCKKKNITNFDQCYNMVEQKHVPHNFNVGWQDNCNDEAEYLPEQNVCSKDCGVDKKCRINTNVLGTRPAYPTKQQNLRDYAKSKNRDFRTDKGPQDTNTCPVTHRRQFACAGDGYPNVQDNTPGCGSGLDVDGGESTIRFCARPHTDWNAVNLAGCCLNNRIGGSKSNSPAPEARCARGYCRSFVPVEEGQVADKCIQPFKVGDKLGCYRMSDTCNNMFKEACTAEVFLNSRICRDGSKTCKQKDKIPNRMNVYCKKWAKIQPNEFNDVAQAVCAIPTAEKKGGSKMVSVGEEGEGEGEGGESDDPDGEKLASLMKGIQGRDVKRKIVSLFTSELCRGYILNNLNTNRTLLTNICKAAVKKNPNGSWSKTKYGHEMKDICPCFYPMEYYEWYKQEKLSKGGKIESSITQSTKIPCFYMDCTATMLYDPVQGDCPDIATCINEIKQNVTVAGSGRGKMQIPSGRQISSGSQACNIQMINKGTGAAAGPAAPAAPGAAAAPGAPAAPGTPGAVPGAAPVGIAGAAAGTMPGAVPGVATGTAPGGSGGQLEGQTIAGMKMDDIMKILGGVFCCFILMMGGVMAAFLGGGPRLPPAAAPVAAPVATA